jgi:hypothetical protein
VCPLAHWQLVVLKYPGKVELACALLTMAVYSSFVALIWVVDSLT